MEHENFMREAIRLARKGEGLVEPNPMVGAVIVRDGKVVASGFHGRFGGLHAETEALKDCREKGIDPAGATMYVTLEPCCHEGKQPPCTDALIKSGIKRVVVGMADPFEPVAGRGIPMLREAGIEVEVGICQSEVEELNAPYLKQGKTGLPWVIVKWAQTLDGKTATKNGDSKWISNEQSRRRVHELRARVDAICVGVGTVQTDDPSLTARDVEVKRIARRVVFDPAMNFPPTSQMAKTLDQAPLTIAVDKQWYDKEPGKLRDLADKGVEVFCLPTIAPDDARRDLRVLLEHLSQTYQTTNFLAEGGSRLSGALIQQGLVDQVLVFVAPKVIGDEKALSAVVGMTCEKLANVTTLSLHSVERIGDDILLDYRCATSNK